MSGRTVKEWQGATPDTPVPPRVRDRIFEAHDRRCWHCSREIRPGDKWTVGHKVALVNGGQNREANLGPECSWCKPVRDAADVAEKSRTYRKRAKHTGAWERPKRKIGIPGLTKKVNGEVVPDTRRSRDG